MTEPLRTHEFKAQKSNKNACEECPHMASNLIHRKTTNQLFVKGTATPNKTG